MNDTTTNSLRFNVGQSYLFIYIDFTQNSPRFGGTYVPWLDTLNKIEVVELKCAEHHKVRYEFDEADAKKKYDGFIFANAEGVVYHNQYPVASYGQLDDSGDRQVRPAKFNEEDPFLSYELATYRLGEIYNAIHKDKAQFTESQAAALQQLYDQITEQVIALGYEIDVSPRTIHFTNGKPPIVTDRMVVRIKKVAT